MEHFPGQPEVVGGLAGERSEVVAQPKIGSAKHRSSVVAERTRRRFSHATNASIYAAQDA
jgi:hypothetical protein